MTGSFLTFVYHYQTMGAWKRYRQAAGFQNGRFGVPHRPRNLERPW